MGKGLRSWALVRSACFLGTANGLIAPQSADSHLPEPSIVIFSGLPLTVLVVTLFMV